MKNSRKRNAAGVALACLITVLTVPSVPSLSFGYSPAKQTTIAEALAEADAVFLGVVHTVKYRLSEEGIPHAFVTSGKCQVSNIYPRVSGGSIWELLGGSIHLIRQSTGG